MYTTFHCSVIGYLMHVGIEILIIKNIFRDSPDSRSMRKKPKMGDIIKYLNANATTGDIDLATITLT